MNERILTEEKAEELVNELIEKDRRYSLEKERQLKERIKNIEKNIREIEL